MIPITKPTIGKMEKEAVMKVLDSGMLAQGPKVMEFENKFAEFCGSKYAIATNSGTSALHTALYALGIKEGDKVITSPFTFVASANSILMQRAKPLFVDIKEDTFNIDPAAVKDHISDKVKAIIPIDLFGQVYDFNSVKKIADQYRIKILEDACQAVGAELDGKKAGKFGDCGAFSFYATKNLITGEGGIITTDDEKYMELAKRFRHHGQSEKTRYEYFDLGYNYRMMDIQAAMGLEQIKKIDALTNKRIENAKLLSEGLKEEEGIETPFVKKGAKHVFHQYTIKVKKDKRDLIVKKLKEQGVGFGVYYPKPLHLHPFFSKMGYKEGDFPVAEEMSRKVISLPVHPSINEADIQTIVNVVKKANE